MDLFAGAGGWSRGLHNAGHEIILAVDNWLPAVNSYKRNFPNTDVRQEDIMHLSHNTLELIQQADIIIGSPPCKTFSTINHRRTKDLSLTIKFLEIVKNKPFIMENVAVVKKLLFEYDKKNHIIPSNSSGYIVRMGDYGVPQIRRRFILSNFLHVDKIEKVVPERGVEYFLPLFDSVKNCKDKPNHKPEIIKRMSQIPNGSSFTKYGDFYRMPRKGLMYAIVNVTKNMTIHYEKSRRLTVGEAAILQTFPLDHIFTGNVQQRAEQIANSVPPIFSELIGRHIENHFNMFYHQQIPTIE